jgi:SEC-C motif-containing protein
MTQCHCGSGQPFDECCGLILSGKAEAATVEQLMRARYSAFAEQDVDFISNSLHPNHRHDHDAEATRRWAANSDWLGLEIVSVEQGQEPDEEGVVEFIATFKEKGVTRHHHERSRFRKEDGRWYFVDGDMVLPQTRVNEGPKVGRNDPCPCGSGKKFKKCCGK